MSCLSSVYSRWDYMGIFGYECNTTPKALACEKNLAVFRWLFVTRRPNLLCVACLLRGWERKISAAHIKEEQNFCAEAVRFSLDSLPKAQKGNA